MFNKAEVQITITEVQFTWDCCRHPNDAGISAPRWQFWDEVSNQMATFFCFLTDTVSAIGWIGVKLTQYWSVLMMIYSIDTVWLSGIFSGSIELFSILFMLLTQSWHALMNVINFFYYCIQGWPKTTNKVCTRSSTILSLK